MALFVIILSTVINATYELNQVKLIISTFRNIIEWNHDLDDEDKVLRLVCTEEISTELIRELKRVGVSSELMEVFRQNTAEYIDITRKGDILY